MSEVIVGKPFLAPGMCFICEQSDQVRYVDTFRDFEGIVREKLDGRKYVCEQCIKEYAGKLGFPTDPKVFEDLEFAKNEITKLEARVKELEPYEAAVTAAVAKIPAKKTAAKAA